VHPDADPFCFSALPSGFCFCGPPIRGGVPAGSLFWGRAAVVVVAVAGGGFVEGVADLCPAAVLAARKMVPVCFLIPGRGALIGAGRPSVLKWTIFSESRVFLFRSFFFGRFNRLFYVVGAHSDHFSWPAACLWIGLIHNGNILIGRVFFSKSLLIKNLIDELLFVHLVVTLYANALGYLLKFADEFVVQL